MLPELIVAHVLLSMCEDRLTAVVVDDGGDPGPWLLGKTLAKGETAEDRLEQILRAADPTILLLLLCGWRTVAIELSADGTGHERIELLGSSLSSPAWAIENEDARWYVPIVRGDHSGPFIPTSDWEIRFELTPQPLVQDRVLVPIDGISGATFHDLNINQRERVIVAVGGSGALSADAIHNLLNEGGSAALESLAALLATAVGKLDERFEDLVATNVPNQTGLLGALVHSRWAMEVMDLATLTYVLSTSFGPVARWMSDQLIDAGTSDRRAFFLAQARRLAGPDRTAIEQVEDVLGAEEETVRGILYEGWLTAEPALTELGRPGTGGAWTGWVVHHALELVVWLRLHDEGVIDMIRPVAENIRADAHAAIDKAWTGVELSKDEYTRILGLRRRYPHDSRVREAEPIILSGVEFGGFCVTGAVGVHADVESQIAEVIADSTLFWGRWRVIGKADADPSASGEHDFLILPYADVAPLSQALWEWSIGGTDDRYVPMATLSEARRLELLAGLGGAQVTLESRTYIKTDFNLLPSPSAVLEAIGLPADRSGLPTGSGVVVGHPDTGVTNPIHSAIDARVWKPVDPKNTSDVNDTIGWPTHGTTTGSAIAGSGSFPGKNPATGIEQMYAAAGVAPSVGIIPWRVGHFVFLMSTDAWWRDSFSPSATSSVEELIRALRFFAGDEGEDRRVDVISISLGYKHDIFRQTAIERPSVTLWPPSFEWTNPEDEMLAELKAAAEYCYDKGVIVCAAAGQVVDPMKGTWFGGPTYPGAFDKVVGCAGLQGDGRAWDPSFRGSGITVAVPCDGAWGCTFDGSGREIIMQSEGTSYSTALTAGVASLWVERYGDDLDRAGHNRAQVFHWVLANCGLDDIRERPGDPTSAIIKGFGNGRMDATKVLDYDFSSSFPI